jgi:hypothetical protein
MKVIMTCFIPVERSFKWLLQVHICVDTSNEMKCWVIFFSKWSVSFVWSLWSESIILFIDFIRNFQYLLLSSWQCQYFTQIIYSVDLWSPTLRLVTCFITMATWIRTCLDAHLKLKQHMKMTNMWLWTDSMLKGYNGWNSWFSGLHHVVS